MTVDWLTLSQYSGQTGSTTVTGTVTDNLNLGVNRYATVRFTNSEGLYADLQITQTAFTEGLSFSVTPYMLDFQVSGETLSGTVISNSKWFITEYPEWISVSSDNPYMEGAGNLYFTAQANTGNTERSGNIKIVSYGEERLIYARQAAYSSLKVSPKTIRLAGATGATATTSVTVTSSSNWEVSDYDSTYLSIYTLSGASGTTTVQFTLHNVPEFYTLGNVPFQQIITFTDHITEETVTINLVGNDNIDDQYVTVTYDVPSAGSFVGYKFAKCQGCPEWSLIFQDANTLIAYSKTVVEKVGNACIEFTYVYFYTNRPGKHTVKYYSEYYSIPFAAFMNNPNIYSVVIGDQNNGEISNFALTNSSTKKLVLGLGTHMQYGTSDALENIYLGDYFYWPDTTWFQSGSFAFTGSSTKTLILQTRKQLYNEISYENLIVLSDL